MIYLINIQNKSLTFFCENNSLLRQVYEQKQLSRDSNQTKKWLREVPCHFVKAADCSYLFYCIIEYHTYKQDI